MGEWLGKYWYGLPALAFVAVLVTLCVCRRGGDESAWRRVWYALFPDVDPANPLRRDVTSMQIMLVAAGLLAMPLALAIVGLVGG